MTAAEFAQFAAGFEPADANRAGTLQYAGDAAARRGAQAVRHGVVIGCGFFGDLSWQPPGLRLRLTTADGDSAAFVNDSLTLDIHGWEAMTHVDALGHVYLDGRGFAGAPLPDLTTGGSLGENSIQAGGFGNGLVSRALVLDLPWVLGVDHLEAGFAADPELVHRALDQLELSPEPGDVLVVPTGAPGAAERVLNEHGRIATGGLSLECAPWVQSSRFALIVSDVGTDPVPSEVEGVATPWHLLALARLGLRLIDNADLSGLVNECRRLRQWTGMITVAPLGIPGASGSPVNPLVVL
jgi:kynurenine formamidase